MQLFTLADRGFSNPKVFVAQIANKANNGMDGAKCLLTLINLAENSHTREPGIWVSRNSGMKDV